MIFATSAICIKGSRASYFLQLRVLFCLVGGTAAGAALLLLFEERPAALPPLLPPDRLP